MITAEEFAIELVSELSPEDVGIYLVVLSGACREHYLETIRQQNALLADADGRLASFQMALETAANKPHKLPGVDPDKIEKSKVRGY